MEEQKTDHSQGAKPNTAVAQVKTKPENELGKAETNISSCSNPETPDVSFIRRYNVFSNKCVLEGMRNIKEIAELFRVREELKLEG